MKKSEAVLPAAQSAVSNLAAERASFSPPPCFYSKWCSQVAEVNKAGRSVCRRCAGTLRGVEYPLRDPSLERIELIRHASLQHNTGQLS